MAGRKHPDTQHRRQHLWHQRETLLRSVRATSLILLFAKNFTIFNFFFVFCRKGTTNGTQPYSSLPPEAVVANSLGVLIVAFGLIVLKILSTSEWQRPDGSEDRTYAVRTSRTKNCWIERCHPKCCVLLSSSLYYVMKVIEEQLLAKSHPPF